MAGRPRRERQEPLEPPDADGEEVKVDLLSTREVSGHHQVVGRLERFQGVQTLAFPAPLEDLATNLPAVVVHVVQRLDVGHDLLGGERAAQGRRMRLLPTSSNGISQRSRPTRR